MTLEQIISLFDEPEADPNGFGSTIYRRFFFDSSRYAFDGNLDLARWRQYDTDQDAWYFGVWVSIEDRAVLSFAEGDLTLVVAPDDEAMRAELKALADFGDPPPAFVLYSDEEDGTVTRTEVFDARPEVT